MNWEEYVPLALRTETRINPHTGAVHGTIERLLHAAIGLCTESGELLDAYKKHIFYGKPLDHVNIKEELGDICWYMAIVCDVVHDMPGMIASGGSKPLLEIVVLNQLCANLLAGYTDPRTWGDLFGPITRAVINQCVLHGFTLDEVLEANIAKLRVRYPEKFDAEKATFRDLAEERKQLEGGDGC